MNTIYVAWQDSVNRRFFPVGRLTKEVGPGGAVFSYVYTQGVHQAEQAGFRPFLAFPSLGASYAKDSLPSFFANRLIPATRADYADFVTSLGLNPTEASEMDILARSGGRRVTDSVELFAAPLRSENGDFVFTFLCHGLSHMPHCAQERTSATLTVGSKLFLMHDLQNEIDVRALLLRTEDYCCAGYVPRYLCDDIWRMLDDGSRIQVSVLRVNPDPAPIQQRLLCEMRSTAVGGFVPCSSEVYQPYATSPVLVDTR